MRQPKCKVCGRKASRWDGGVCGVVRDANGVSTPRGIIYLCKKHDPGHKHFDLPETLPEAIAELMALREELQQVMFATSRLRHL